MRISDWSSDVCSSDLATDVAGVGDLWQLVAIMIAGAAFRAGETTGDAVDQRILVDDEFDDMVELAAARAEQPVERLCLRRGARIAVEDQDRKSTRLNSSH